MRKEQLADNVTLYCGDCREVVPTLRGIDAVVVDPPYGIEDLVKGYGRHGGEEWRRRGRVERQTIANDKNLDVVGEAFDLLRKQLKNAWVAAFYSCRISPDFFKMMEQYTYFGEMIWDKKAPGLGSQIRYQHENVGVFKVGKPPDLQDVMSVMTYLSLKIGGAGARAGDDDHHPHEKPMQVMLNIVGMVPGKLVLDPFMGTGSTGAAAVKLKRGFIGIELNPKYFEIGIKKVRAALEQPEAFWE